MSHVTWTAGIAAAQGEAAGRGGARARDGLRWLRAGPGRLIETLEAWRERDRLRRELAALSDQTLKDIGLSRGQVLYETQKPVWKPVERDWLAHRRHENTAITVNGTVLP